MAKAGARTELVLVADAELVPSAGFVPAFRAFFTGYRARHPNVVASNVAFVIPVFEAELGEEVRAPFQSFHLQRPTNSRWEL